ncbi:NADP-dependent oxidoreductase domain-containing protein [Pelagophyceae sp. CCMP2097]|nr:NADP-dependent oxidoreductase domain-containing protein [Pelagophyceae sp. CCMP2097]
MTPTALFGMASLLYLTGAAEGLVPNAAAARAGGAVPAPRVLAPQASLASDEVFRPRPRPDAPQHPAARRPAERRPEPQPLLAPLWARKLATAGGAARPAAAADEESVIVSKVVFGTLRLHETKDSAALLDEAWRLGITTFDCAAVYGDGACEKALGAWLRRPETPELARRTAVIITKGGCGNPASGWAPRLGYDDLRFELHESLKRLGRVDAYLLHRDEPTRPVGEIVETMHRLLQEEPSVRSWGVSNWGAARIDAALEYAKRHGLKRPEMSSLQDSLAEPKQRPWPGTEVMRDSDRAWYAKSRVTVLGWEAIGKGFLAGRWTESDVLEVDSETDFEKPPADPAKMGEWREQRLTQAYLTPDNFARRRRATLFGSLHGLKPEHVALAWNLAQAYESHVITATVNIDHLRSNILALQLELTPDDCVWLKTGDEACTPDCVRRHFAAVPHAAAHAAALPHAAQTHAPAQLPPAPRHASQLRHGGARVVKNNIVTATPAATAAAAAATTVTPAKHAARPDAPGHHFHGRAPQPMPRQFAALLNSTATTLPR